MPLLVAHLDPYARREVEQLPLTGGRAAVLFSAMTNDDGAGLVMAGTARHLVSTGHGPGDPLPVSWSNLIRIRQLIRHYAQPVELEASDPIAMLDPPNSNEYGSYHLWDGIDGVFEAFDLMEEGGKLCPDRTVLGECEFLAKRLDSSTIRGKLRTLATPLFVSLVN